MEGEIAVEAECKEIDVAEISSRDAMQADKSKEMEKINK
jgi:hypothetical protein